MAPRRCASSAREPMAALRSLVVEVVESETEGLDTAEICRRLNRSPQRLGDAFERLKRSGVLEGFAGHWLTKAQWEAQAERIVEAIRNAPRSSALTASNLLRNLGASWRPKPFARMLARLEADGRVLTSGKSVRIPSKQSTVRASELLDRTIEAIEQPDSRAPSPRNLAGRLNAPVQAVEAMLQAGAEQGLIIVLDGEFVYTRAQLAAMAAAMDSAFRGRRFTVSEARQTMGVSRTAVIPVLSWLESKGHWRWQGDARLWHSRAVGPEGPH